MIAVHVATVTLAMVVETVVRGRGKGTRGHRRLGWVYATLVATMAASSFGIYQLRDGPSIFHSVSGLVMAVVVVGLLQPRRRRRADQWHFWHAVLMPASLLMIVVTGVTQFFERLPIGSDALNAIVFVQLPLVVGFVLIGRIARCEHRPPLGRPPRDLPPA